MQLFRIKRRVLLRLRRFLARFDSTTFFCAVGLLLEGAFRLALFFRSRQPLTRTPGLRVWVGAGNLVNFGIKVVH